MLYNKCYITFPELLYNIQVWLHNIQDGYTTHPNLPDGVTVAGESLIWKVGMCYITILKVI